MSSIALPIPIRLPSWKGLLGGLLGLWLAFTTITSNTFNVDVTAVDGDYFVDCDDGNDSNTGTSFAQPWATLQKAADVVVPGDVVLIMDGVCFGSSQTSSSLVSITRSGSAGNPITFKNHPGHSPQIGSWPAVSSEVYGFLFFQGARYFNIEGLTFRGMKFACLFLGNNDPGGGDFTVTNNVFDGCGKGETSGTDTNGHNAIYSGRHITGTNLYEYNIFKNTGRVYDVACDALGDANCHQYRHDHALYLHGQGHIVRNNVFHTNDMGFGVKIDGSAPSTLPAPTGTGLGTTFTHVIVNNTFGPNNCLQPFDGRCGNGIVVFKNFDDGGEVQQYPRYLIANNLLIENSVSGNDNSAVQIHSGTSSSNSPYDNYCLNNISTGTQATMMCNDDFPAYAANITIANNLVQQTTASAELVNLLANDYHIGATSVAIDIGDSTLQSVPSDDFDENIRDFVNNKVDVGAYEN